MRTTAGRFGSALDFDGVNDWVTVADSASLRLTTGMTLEGWAYPTGGERLADAGAEGDRRQPRLGAVPVRRRRAPERARGNTAATCGRAARPLPALNTWTHFAITYDGATIRLYVNGVQAGTRAQTGTLLTSTQALRFGGNAVWPEWFRGRLDEIRVYDRALTAAQIQADMAKAVSSPTLLRAAGEGGREEAGARAKRRHGGEGQALPRPLHPPRQVART